MTVTGAAVRVERDGALAVLTLDRPEVLNAFDEAMTAALGSGLNEVAADHAVRAVVITGAGRAFSAGQDLRDRAAVLARGAELRLIAAVNGVVAGAGLGIVAACDLRVASSSALFRAAWGRVGLVPDAASAYFLPRIVGWGRAMHMVLTGDAVPADEALRIGLVGRVWREEEFAAGWRTFARELATGATETYALSKEGLNAGLEEGLPSFLEVEATLQDRAGRTADYAEGVRAFLEKRKASFGGK